VRSWRCSEIHQRQPGGLTKLVESRQERLARWRFDVMIAATALGVRMPLIHNNAADFESIRTAIERSPDRFPHLGPLELIRCGSLT
jgi:hypothetical protein